MIKVFYQKFINDLFKTMNKFLSFNFFYLFNEIAGKALGIHIENGKIWETLVALEENQCRAGSWDGLVLDLVY